MRCGPHQSPKPAPGQSEAEDPFGRPDDSWQAVPPAVAGEGVRLTAALLVPGLRCDVDGHRLRARRRVRTGALTHPPVEDARACQHPAMEASDDVARLWTPRPTPSTTSRTTGCATRRPGPTGPALLARLLPDPPVRVADLGCGPGTPPRRPLDEGAYDVVLCRHVLWAPPDQDNALARWVRLLDDRVYRSGPTGDRTVRRPRPPLSGSRVRRHSATPRGTVRVSRATTNRWRPGRVSG